MLLDPGGPGFNSRVAFALAGSTQLVSYRLGTHTLFICDEARSLHLRYGLHALCLRFTLVVRGIPMRLLPACKTRYGARFTGYPDWPALRLATGGSSWSSRAYPRAHETRLRSVDFDFNDN